jgi:hypothetical protein
MSTAADANRPYRHGVLLGELHELLQRRCESVSGTCMATRCCPLPIYNPLLNYYSRPKRQQNDNERMRRYEYLDSLKKIHAMQQHRHTHNTHPPPLASSSS